LHRRGFVVGDGKRTLALISQQVTIPLFSFTKIICCNQDWSNDPCPDTTQSLKDVWLLSFWPAYVVAAGMAVGLVVAKATNTPPNQARAALACCASGNSTGLPITLLTVVHANFPAASDLGRIDPTLFLSVCLLLCPVLQWGVGGWLLAPEKDDKEATQLQEHVNHALQGLETIPLTGNSNTVMSMDNRTATATAPHRLAHNVLNNVTTEHLHNRSRRGLSETDASLCMSVQEDLNMWDPMTATMHGTVVKDVEPALPPPPPPPLDQQNLQEQQRPHTAQTTTRSCSDSLDVV
jgi:predicted permease